MAELPPVLIIEDEYFLQADLERALAAAGFTFVSVPSGEEALPLFGNSRFCAVITDVRLRDSLTGWDVARWIRSRRPDFPVIYLTASSVAEWATEGVPNSVLIAKPFADAQLVRALSSLLDIQPSATPHSLSASRYRLRASD